MMPKCRKLPVPAIIILLFLSAVFVFCEGKHGLTDNAIPAEAMEGAATGYPDAPDVSGTKPPAQGTVENGDGALPDDGSAPSLPFTMDLSNTPASRNAPVAQSLDGFEDEAVFEGAGVSYRGLLSECFKQAVEAGSGTVTLIKDVSAHAYDPSVYDGTSYTENGTAHAGAPHAITRFTGGLGTMAVPSGVDITLDLGGHVLDRNMGEADGTADRAYTIEVFDGGAFTLSDSVGGGKLTGGYGASCLDHTYGSCVLVHEGGAFTLSGAEISGNTGRGAVIGDGRVAITGAARITGNTDASGNACNLYVAGSLDVSAGGLAGNVGIGITAAPGRETDAVYSPDGDTSLFTSDAGLGVHKEGDYVAVGEEKECEWEAEFHSHTGSVYTGTFAEMFSRMKTDHTGTLKIMKNITVSGTYTWNVWGTAVIDFNGHVVSASGTSTQNFLTISSGATSGITLTDTSGKAKERTRRVAAIKEPSYDRAKRTYTYYVTRPEDGGTDTGMVAVTDEVSADFSNLGGLDISGYNRAVLINTGSSVTISGGAYRSDNGFLQSAASRAKVSFTDGYIYGCCGKSSSVISGGAFWMQTGGSFSMMGGTIAGCMVKQGGAIRADTLASLSLSGGAITQCYGGYNGGAAYISNNCTNITFGNVLLCNNTSGERGGAVMLSQNTASFDGTVFAGNHGVSGGALQLLSNKGSASLTGCIFIGNTATTGGAIAHEDGVSPKISLSGTTITGNEAVTGGGLCFGSGEVLIGDNNDISKNKNSNVYLKSGAVMTLACLPGASHIGVATEAAPQEGAPVKIASGQAGWDITKCKDWFFSDGGYYVRQDGDYVVLSLDSGGEAPGFDGVLLQHYAYVDRLGHSPGTGYELSLIDTSGGVLPANDTTPPLIHMYVDKSGGVVTGPVLTKIYENRDVEPGVLDIAAISTFKGNNYSIYEIWKAKPGTDPDSTDPSGWDAIPYEKGKTYSFSRGDIVRLVAKETTGMLDVNALFYDYDIMDGGWYTSIDDAKAGINKQPTSAQPDKDDRTAQYVNTAHYGINSNGNYKESGAKFSFGNANTSVDWCAEAWDSPTGRININRYNRASNGVNATFGGAAYGIPSHLDGNYNIVYSDGLDVPMLFGRGPAEGKSTYTKYGFDFKRSGDAYTLTAVSNTDVKDLDKFHNPGIYDGVQNPTTIWTNGFWPMDAAPSYGMDGHDLKFGAKERATNRTLCRSTDGGPMPEADAGKDHNSYFGFQFGITFSVPEGYRRPMEYVFFGDDDIWVFLDGELICDIGGVHSAIGEYVNIWDYIEEDDTSEHRLSVFYTERGASGSTCWMRFTLPNVSPFPQTAAYSFTKTGPGNAGLSGAEFSLYGDRGCENLLDTQVSGPDGDVTFIGLTGTNSYYIRETKAPDGFALDDTVYRLGLDDDMAWYLYKADDAGKVPVFTVENRPEEHPALPNTGSRGMLYLLLFGGMLLTSSLGAYGLARRREGGGL